MDILKKQEALRRKAIWAPTPKQEEALVRPEFEIGFGGARGGGKTDAGINWLGYDVKHPRLRALIIRKNSIDLGDWVARARRYFAPEGVEVVGNPPRFRFPSGAEFVTGHLKDEKAYEKYQGQEFQRLLAEELELIASEENYEKLLASCRTTVPELKAQAFSTFNPGGPGHTWIKRRFRLNGIPTQKIITKDAKTGRMRIFIPARVDDNPFLVNNDPDYVSFLEGLPDGLREQWRYGSWDDPIMKGAFYTLEIAQARREGRVSNVPHDPSKPVHTWWDIGNDTTSIGFFQFIGKAIHVIDYYQNDSLGFPHYVAKLNQKRDELHYSYGTHHFPHDMEHSEWGSGRTRTEVLEEMGWDYQIVVKLPIQEGIEAVRLVFPKCYFDKGNTAQLVDGLQNAKKKWDAEKQTYVNEMVHDWASHPSDMFRYMAVSIHENVRPDISKRPSEFLKDDIRELGVTREPGRRFSDEFSGENYPQSTSRFHYGEG